MSPIRMIFDTHAGARKILPDSAYPAHRADITLDSPLQSPSFGISSCRAVSLAEPTHISNVNVQKRTDKTLCRRLPEKGRPNSGLFFRRLQPLL